MESTTERFPMFSNVSNVVFEDFPRPSLSDANLPDVKFASPEIVSLWNPNVILNSNGSDQGTDIQVALQRVEDIGQTQKKRKRKCKSKRKANAKANAKEMQKQMLRKCKGNATQMQREKQMKCKANAKANAKQMQKQMLRKCK